MSGFIYHDGVLLADKTCLEHAEDGDEAFKVYTEVDKVFRSKWGDLAILKLGKVVRKPDDIEMLEMLSRLARLALDVASSKGNDVMEAPISYSYRPTTRQKADQLIRMKDTGLLDGVYVMSNLWFFKLGIKLEKPEKKVYPVLKLSIEAMEPAYYHTDGSMGTLLVYLIQAGYSPEQAMQIAIRHHVHSRDFGYDKVTHEDLRPMGKH